MESVSSDGYLSDPPMRSSVPFVSLLSCLRRHGRPAYPRNWNCNATTCTYVFEMQFALTAEIQAGHCASAVAPELVIMSTMQ